MGATTSRDEFSRLQGGSKGEKRIIPKKVGGGNLTAYNAVYIRYGVSRNNTVISLFTLDA